VTRVRQRHVTRQPILEVLQSIAHSKYGVRPNHLPSPWARFKRDVEYAARRWLYPDGTAHRTAWLYGYDVAAEEQYRAAAPAPV